MISIVIPTYNAAPYIGRCIESIKAQTYKEWECIIVDDGSTDGTDIQASALTKGDPRFVVFHFKDNKGVAWARNYGVSCAFGDVTFIDADDWVDDIHLELLHYEALAHPECGRIIHPAVIHPTGGKIRFWDIEPIGVLAPDNPALFASTKCDVGHVTGSLYREWALPSREDLFADVPCHEDLLFNVELIFAGVKSFVSGEYTYHYTRRGGNALTAQHFSEEDARAVRVALVLIKNRYEVPSEIVWRVAAFINNLLERRLGK